VSYRNKTYVIFDGDNDMWGLRVHEGLEVEREHGLQFL